MDHSDQAPFDPLTLDVYNGNHGAEFRLYEDDGVSVDYRKGSYAWTTITFESAARPGNYVLAVGPAQGHFSGQLAERRYLVRLHGLLRPHGVLWNGAELPETGPDSCAPGWTWDGTSRTTTIRPPTATAVHAKLALEIQGAETFAEAIVIQKALNLRSQVRQAKRLMKLKHAELLAGADVKKPPRVIRRTEEVERELTAIIHNRSSSEGPPPDFQAMRRRVLDALNDYPFESDRTIPDVEPETIEATKKIQNARFTGEEIRRIAKLLRGADVPAWLNP